MDAINFSTRKHFPIIEKQYNRINEANVII